MIAQISLLRSAADQIDRHDADIRVSNADKKDIYAFVRESVAPEIFKAWRDAVKLRQKRAASEDARIALEDHDARVWELLAALESNSGQPTREPAPAASASPANGTVEETAPTRARLHDAHEAAPHDPDTGEIIEPQASVSQPAQVEEGGVGPSSSAPAESGEVIHMAAVQAAPQHSDDLDLPAFLDRRARVA